MRLMMRRSWKDFSRAKYREQVDTIVQFENTHLCNLPYPKRKTPYNTKQAHYKTSMKYEICDRQILPST